VRLNGRGLLLGLSRSWKVSIFGQKTAYERATSLEFRRVLFRSSADRRPTEFEWEPAAVDLPIAGNFVDRERFHPAPVEAAPNGKIGRASCRERVENRGGVVLSIRKLWKIHVFLCTSRCTRLRYK